LDKRTLLSRIKTLAYLEGDFTTRSGKKTSYYIDKYLFETQPDVLAALAQHFLPLMPASCSLIAAPELGAVSIAAVLSTAIDTPFVIVRKETKAYGTQRLLEGIYGQQESVVIVEDVLTTGGAALRSADILRQAGLTVTHIIGVINREEGAFDNIREAGIEPLALFSASELRQA
jgi:orotate phosphoribosyltransferase